MISKEYWVVRVKHSGTAILAVLLKYVTAVPTCIYVVSVQYCIMPV